MNRFSGRFDQELPVAFVRLGEERPQIADGALAGQLLIVAGQGRLSIDDPWIQAAKPACVLFVVPQDRLRTESVNRVEESPVELPSGMIAEDAADKLAASAGVAADLLKGGNPLENVLVQTTRRLHVQLAIERESLDIPNVVAWYPGADESLRHEHIAIGAHLDHLGVQRGEVFPGADDNGSGSAAILQIAQAIHLNPVKPKRSVLFLAFCAEERGLLGSKVLRRESREAAGRHDLYAEHRHDRSQ